MVDGEHSGNNSVKSCMELQPGQILLLASASPRRAELLRKAKVPFTVKPADIDESRWEGELWRDYIMRMSAEKAKAAARVHGKAGDLILAADTIVVFQEHILGKPGSMEEAKHMLRRLSGQRHKVATSASLLRLCDEGSRIVTNITETDVFFKSLTDDIIDTYFSLVNPMDKAGSYAIQEYGDMVVDHIENGSFDNVMGLDVASLHLIPEL